MLNLKKKVNIAELGGRIKLWSPSCAALSYILWNNVPVTPKFTFSKVDCRDVEIPLSGCPGIPNTWHDVDTPKHIFGDWINKF